MVYTNYPGSICLGIYNAINNAPTVLRIGWQLLFVFIVLFLSVVTYLKMQYPERIKNLKRFKWLFSPASFILVLCLGVFILRLPNMIIPRLDVDEEQWIVAGISYLHGGVFWQSITGNTSGPLVFSLPLIMIPVDGLNYTTIRLFGMLVCIIPAIYMIWKSLKLLYGSTAAQISLISLFIFFASINEGDFIAYNSEHLPMLLTSLAIYFLFRMSYTGSHSSVSNILVLGLVLGIMPYTKLQIMPLGICIGLIGIADLIIQKKLTIGMRAKRVLILSAAALFPTILVGIYLTIHHAWGDFWINYIQNNLQYAMHNGANSQLFPVYSGMDKMIFVPLLLLKNHYLTKFVVTHILIVFILALFQIRSGLLKSIFYDKFLWYSILILFSSYLSVSAPGNRFNHYIYLFIFPFVFTTGCFIGKLLSFKELRSSYQAFIFIPCLIYIFLVFLKSPTPQGYDFVVSKQTLSMTEQAKIIKKYTHPGEWMSLWGWGINGFVETDLVMANKSNSPYWSMFNGDNPSLLEEYIGEIKAKKPIVFVDAMPEIMLVKEKFRHENYPLLNQYITQNYKKVGEYEYKRIYVRNDRQREVDSLSLH